MRWRVAKEESGFTLPEVLVAMVMMLTVMFALYSIFDMSLRVFSFGNDKVEAVVLDAGGDVARQIAQMEDLIQQEVDAIIIWRVAARTSSSRPSCRSHRTNRP